jgi:recombination protein RecA
MSKALQELTESLPEPKSNKKEPTKLKLESKEDKFAALKNVEKLINKQFDTTNSLVRLGDREIIPVPSIATGLPTLDYILGTGLPIGRICEAYGAESGGKTTLALWLISEYQRQGHLCAFVDAEHSFDISWASKLGVDTENLFINQPDSGEEALTVVEEVIKTGTVGLIVIDSVSALVPQAELDGEMGSANIGLQARLMSQAMRKLRGIADENKCTLLFINQIREKVGVIYGSPEVTSGGRALKFYASVRLDLRRKEAIKDGDIIIGHTIKIKCTKNKVSTPFRETTIDLLYETGIDKFGNIVADAVAKGAIERSGAWYSLSGGDRLGQGIENVKQALLDDPALLKNIQEKIKIGLDKPQTV